MLSSCIASLCACASQRQGAWWNAETYMLEVNGVRFIGEQVRAGGPTGCVLDFVR